MPSFSLRSLRSFAANLRFNNFERLTMMTVFELCDIVRETAYAVHSYHAHGHLEKVYENALAHRLRKLGLDVKQQYAITVQDEDGTVVGEYFADLYVQNCLIVELKAAKSLSDEHIAQLLGYLKSSRVEHGLLINFGRQLPFPDQEVCALRSKRLFWQQSFYFDFAVLCDLCVLLRPLIIAASRIPSDSAVFQDE